MDLLTVAGILVVILAIGSAHIIDGGHLIQLISLPAFLMVFGGTLGAVMLQTPWPVFKRFCRIVRWVIVPPKFSMDKGISKVVFMARETRKRGLLVLEDLAREEKDSFIRKALMLIIDAYTADELRAALTIELESEEHEDLEAVRVFESMGGYSPTIGILGTVLALIKVMGDLSDPAVVGAGIAVAFVATIYGVGFANLIFLPVAEKVKALVFTRSRAREMLIEGFVGIAEGENPHMLKARLSGYAGHN